MINSTSFAERLHRLMEFYQLNASALADRIGVQRSAISHILSGRNNPSLDFVLKIAETFTDVDLYWLLLNKGSFPTPQKAVSDYAPYTQLSSTDSEPEKISHYEQPHEKKEISKVIIFYENGTFESFEK